MGLGSFLRNPIKNAPGMNQAKKLINKAPGVSQANKLLGKVPGATKMLNKGPAGELIPGNGNSGGQVGRSPSGPPQFQNPNGRRAQFYEQTGIVPPRTGGGGGPAATGGWDGQRNPSALPLGGQGIAAMVRPWEQGGIGNQPGQPPMASSQFPPQLNRQAVQPPGWGQGGRMDMGPEASRWNQQFPPQQPMNPANPSLPPQQAGPGWQGGNWQVQSGIPQGGGMNQSAVMPPGYRGQTGMPPNYQQQGGYKGMGREQFPNPMWGGSTPRQQQPGMGQQKNRMLF